MQDSLAERPVQHILSTPAQHVHHPVKATAYVCRCMQVVSLMYRLLRANSSIHLGKPGKVRYKLTHARNKHPNVTGSRRPRVFRIPSRVFRFRSPTRQCHDHQPTCIVFRGFPNHDPVGPKWDPLIAYSVGPTMGVHAHAPMGILHIYYRAYTQIQVGLQGNGLLPKVGPYVRALCHISRTFERYLSMLFEHNIINIYFIFVFVD